MSYLASHNANIWLQAARQIKRSMGLQRGKTDRLDAPRIARYASIHQQQAQLWQPPGPVVEERAVLLGLREGLTLVGQQLSVPLKELKQLTNSTIARASAKLCKVSLKAIPGDIHRTEMAIKELINNDEELKRRVSLMTSIQGVDQISACEVILTTNEFKHIKQPGQYACYAGVAPFEDSSGKKQSRARVSHMANKKALAFSRNGCHTL
jgi:transposase